MFLSSSLIDQFNHLSIGFDQGYLIIAMDICKDAGRKPLDILIHSDPIWQFIVQAKELFVVNFGCDQTGQAHSYHTCMFAQ